MCASIALTLGRERQVAKRISDLYIVESLLQSTEARPSPLCWNQTSLRGEALGGYNAQVGTVQVVMRHVQEPTCSRLWLTLSDGFGRIHVQEPGSVGLLSRRYRCEDEQRLAEAIRRLHRAVIRQCRARAVRSCEEAESTRERIFRQLLFGRPGLQPGD
jgi:hypothetical protein